MNSSGADQTGQMQRVNEACAEIMSDTLRAIQLAFSFLVGGDFRGSTLIVFLK